MTQNQWLRGEVRLLVLHPISCAICVVLKCFDPGLKGFYGKPIQLPIPSLSTPTLPTMPSKCLWKCLALIDDQLMINWWFGAGLVWIPGISLWKGLFLRANPENNSKPPAPKPPVYHQLKRIYGQKASPFPPKEPWLPWNTSDRKLSGDIVRSWGSPMVSAKGWMHFPQSQSPYKDYTHLSSYCWMDGVFWHSQHKTIKSPCCSNDNCTFKVWSIFSSARNHGESWGSLHVRFCEHPLAALIWQFEVSLHLSLQSCMCKVLLVWNEELKIEPKKNQPITYAQQGRPARMMMNN